MSAVNFVVRSVAGNIERGSVGAGGARMVVVSTGEAVSLNLSASQVAGYARNGQALEITLADGSVIVVQGVFTPSGEQQADVYVSADGALHRVSLADAGNGQLTGTYVEPEVYGKWSPEDDLFFVRGTDLAYSDLAVVAPADAEAGMLAVPLLAGLGGVAPAVGIGGAALVGGGLLISALSGSAGAAPMVSITDGTVTSGDITNAQELADDGGVKISGTGTPGAAIKVETQGGSSVETTVGQDGKWEVILSGGDVVGGEYDLPVTVTLTDGGDTVTITDTVRVDTVVNVGFDASVQEGDGVVNAAEAADGMQLFGTVDAGATVVVTVEGREYNATVTGTAWTVGIPVGGFPTGETSVNVSVRATDAAGNTNTASGTVAIDTITHVTLNPGTVSDGMVINAAEASDGTSLSGTAQANASVQVTMNGVARTVTADANGNWSAAFPASALPAGETTMPVSVTATDAAGNTATATGSVKVDTIVNALNITNDITGGDGVINGAEAGAQVQLTGQVEPGSALEVSIQGVAATVQVAADGSWTAVWPAGALPSGEYDSVIKVKATDAAGNTRTLEEPIRVDTLVNNLTSTDPVEGDNIVNAAEAADGITLTGTVEKGSTVRVEFQGKTFTATVDANGNWSADIPAGDIRQGDYQATATITATDAAGNTSSITDSFRVDTVAPNAPLTGDVRDSGLDVQGIFTDANADGYTINAIDGGGNVTNVAGVKTSVGTDDLYSFNSPVPDGSDLIVTSTDASGNSASTFFVQQDGSTTVNIDTAALADFEITAIDLDIIDNGQLTLSHQNIQDLAKNSNDVTIFGGSDDTVTISGATATGNRSTVDGRSVAEYTMGSGADMVTIMIDENVQVVT